jgi:hypothetical protein
VADDFAQHIVDYRRARLAAHMIAGLGFDNRESPPLGSTTYDGCEGPTRKNGGRGKLGLKA